MNNSFTLTSWILIEPNDVNNYLRIISKHGEVTDAGGSHGSYQLVTGRPDKRGVIYTTLKSARYFSSDPGIAVTLGEWHFIASTWDGKTVITYYDGKPVAHSSASGNIMYDNNDLYFGKDGFYDNAYFKGCIDDLKIFNKALTDKEVLNLYNTN